MSVTRKGAGAGVTMRGPTLQDFNFEILESAAPEILNPPSVSSVVEGDRIYDVYDPGDWLDNRQLSINAPEDAPAPQYISLGESVGTVDQEGKLTQVAEGDVSVLVKFPLLTKRIDLTLSSAASTTKTQTGWVAGSFGAVYSGDLDAALDGLASANALNVFTSRDGPGKVFVRNPDCWCEPITSASVWRSGADYKWPAHAVTARHVLMAAHADAAIGTELLFVEADGTVHSRTIIRKERHPGYAPKSLLSVDISIGLLDAALPTGIVPAHILPADYGDRVTLDGALVPTVCINQFGEALVTDVRNLLTACHLKKPTDPVRLDYYKEKVWGDSSCGVYLRREGSVPILLGALTSGGEGSGSAIHTRISEVNQLIVDVDNAEGIATGLTLTEADLTGFPIY